MDQHISFSDEEDLRHGKKLPDDKKKHLKGCTPCKVRLGGTTQRQTIDSDSTPSRWQRFLKVLKSIFSKKKSP